MSFGQAISSGFNNYVNFSGRASRSGLWYWVLFVIIVNIVAGIIDSVVFGANTMAGKVGVISTLASLALLIPSLAVEVRRLHDIDRTGWWLLLAFIPLVGIIVLIVWFCTRGTPGPNRFGPPPAVMFPAMAARA